MPLHEYQCDACGCRFEVIQKFSDPPVDVCRSCGKGPVQRLLSSPAIQFKGTGWYVTDYAQKGKSESGGGKEKGKTEESKPEESKTDTAAKTETTTKSDSKSDSSSTSGTATPTTTKE